MLAVMLRNFKDSYALGVVQSSPTLNIFANADLIETMIYLSFLHFPNRFSEQDCLKQSKRVSLDCIGSVLAALKKLARLCSQHFQLHEDA